MRYRTCISIKVSVVAVSARGPTPMAEWSKALPLAASCLSPLPKFEFRPGQVRKFPVAEVQAVVFAGCFNFIHHLRLTSHDLAAIWHTK